MAFRFTPAAIAEVVFITPQIFEDARGYFMETYKHSEFAEHGIADVFVQSNFSRSVKHTLRGLHYQNDPKAQGKLVLVLAGEIFDVVVDIRRNSPTYRKWVGKHLSASNKTMVYVPVGFAHGFSVVSETAEVMYMVTQEYAPDKEAGIVWHDSDLAITWPTHEPVVSARDQHWPCLRDADNNFLYGNPANLIS